MGRWKYQHVAIEAQRSICNSARAFSGTAPAVFLQVLLHKLDSSQEVVLQKLDTQKKDLEQMRALA